MRGKVLVPVDGAVDLLTPTEAQRLLRVSRSWLYGAAKDGRIPSIRIGGPDGPLRFVRSDLVEHIEAARAAWRFADTGAQTLRRVRAEHSRR